MKKKIALMFFALACSVGTTAAQFPLKIPKIKVDGPTTDKPTTRKEDRTNQPQTNRPTADAKVLYPVTLPTGTPVLLKNTVYVQAKTHDEYWKMPNQRNYSSWVPLVRFGLFYNNEKSLEYTVEYFHPDGSAWYRETLEQSTAAADRVVNFQSPSPYGGVLDTKSTAATGVYSFRITERGSGAKVFEGKFKVGKFARGGQEKNKVDFYVEHDWLAPFGMIGFHHSDIEIGGVPPLVSVWLRGQLTADELEGRLFYQGRQLASTKDAGGVSDYDERTTNFAPPFAPEQIWKRWEFQWNNFLYDNNGRFNRENYPNAHYADKNPGEYTVRIYRRGAPIRELSFTVGSDGRLVAPAYTGQIYMPYHRLLLPVKNLDAAEKTSAAWQTEAFYGNPLNGFAAR